MSEFERQKSFQKIKKSNNNVIFFRLRFWDLPVSKQKLRPRSVSVLVSEKFCGLGLGLVNPEL